MQGIILIFLRQTMSLGNTVTSPLLGPNILLNTLFSNTLSFLSSRNVSDQVSHPYKTTGKILYKQLLLSRNKTIKGRNMDKWKKQFQQRRLTSRCRHFRPLFTTLYETSIGDWTRNWLKTTPFHALKEYVRNSDELDFVITSELHSIQAKASSLLFKTIEFFP